VAEFTRVVLDAARAAAPGEWILTSIGWHQSNLAENRLPTMAELDAAAPDHPVLSRRGGHLAVANSAALRNAGTRPSESFKRQCYISFDPDEESLVYTVNSRYMGADRIVWASDYPHPDAKIPGVVAELEEATVSLTEEQRELVFGSNACRLYGI
jgi:predicted TIM-barrel fold metal-dependent hydrolase